MNLARPNSRAEYIRIHAVVVPELKPIDIQRKILARDFMERANNPALHDRPESFDGVGVNCAIARLTGERGAYLWNTHSTFAWPAHYPELNADIFWSMWHGTAIALMLAGYLSRVTEKTFRCDNDHDPY